MTEDSRKLLIILTRNPVPGKCKTRLAAKVGDKKALDIYKFLLDHTMGITIPLPVNKVVYYSETILQDDIWNPEFFHKELQQGATLGDRMHNAFKKGFDQGYNRIVIIGSDVYDLSTEDLAKSFNLLENQEVVIGPAEDGGYYLLGLKTMIPELFRDKAWGTNTVFKETLNDLQEFEVCRLPIRNDVDRYEDIKNHPAFQSFLIDLDP